MQKKTRNNNIKYSKKMLAVALDVDASHVQYAVRTKKIIQDSDGYIDLQKKVNSLWLKIQLEKGKTFEPERIVQYNKDKAKYREARKQKRVIKNSLEIDNNDITTEVIKSRKGRKTKQAPSPLDSIIDAEIADLSTEKIKTEIEYKKGQIALNKIKEDKYSGVLVPTDAVKNLFAFAIENMRALFLQEMQSIANIYQQRAEMEHSEYVELQKELTLKVSDIMKIYKKQLKDGVNGIVEEYQEVRNRGEVK